MTKTKDLPTYAQLTEHKQAIHDRAQACNAAAKALRGLETTSREMFLRLSGIHDALVSTGKQPSVQMQLDHRGLDIVLRNLELVEAHLLEQRGPIKV